MSSDALRGLIDRVDAEEAAVTADPVHLIRLFGISPATVMLTDDSRRRAWIVHQWAAVLDATLAPGGG